MVVDVLNTEGKKVSEVDLPGEVFEGEVNEALFYEVVKMQLANRRRGCASTKTRAEVSGGGAKPWRQKGTGRARAGSIRSPIWRHGGTVFGPRPRDYSYKVPKKVVKGAVRSALRLKLREGKLRVLDSLELSEPKCKVALEFFKKIGVEHALVVIDGRDRTLELAVRNLANYKVLDAGAINVYDILYYDELVLTRTALEKVVSKVQ